MKRPHGVTIIGALMLFQGLTVLLLISLVVALEIAGRTEALPPGLVPTFTAVTVSSLIAVGAQAALGVLSLVGGIAILQLRPWAWFVAMTLQGITLATNLVGYFQGRPLYLMMLLAVVIVFYLNSRPIRQVFDLVQRRTDSPSQRVAAADMLPTAAAPIPGAAPGRAASAGKEH